MNETVAKIITPAIFQTPYHLGPVNAWHGHMPFAFWCIENLRPKVFVELGTHYGDSFCSMCQAVKSLKVPSQTYAIDTWQGDEHAGYYDDRIYLNLRAYHDVHYGGFSRLLRSTFDEALGGFGDKSIDLLHIDGLHTYEAVKHDFESWRPKLSDQGVVIFHDINVHERSFGVWKLWNELKVQYPSFDFSISHGLGFIAYGKNPPEAALRLCNLNEQDAELVKTIFGRLGNAVLLQSAAQEGRNSVRHHEALIREKDNMIRNLSDQLEQRDLLLKIQASKMSSLHDVSKRGARA